MNAERHAYLIMCHNHFEQLMMMLAALDDERNDFYIHVDKKSISCPKGKIQSVVKKGTCVFVDSIEVNWGAYSQISCELILLKAAVQKQHVYYHLLSGVDFPIKSQREIHNFFERNCGKEFLGFCKEDQRKDFLYRVCLYHFFQERIGNEKGQDFGTRQWCKWEHRLLKIQKWMHVDRLKKQHDIFYKGANWFSITHGLATYVISQEKLIKKIFRWSNCGDEGFLQTIAMMSPYKDHIVRDHMRLIDWERGTPYIFRKEDYEQIKSSPYMFARKFDEQVDREIIDMLYHDCMENNE